MMVPSGRKKKAQPADLAGRSESNTPIYKNACTCYSATHVYPALSLSAHREYLAGIGMCISLAR